MTTVPHAVPGVPLEGQGEAQLMELLQSFTDTAERLQATHDALHSQVGKLESELAEANEQLHRSRELTALGEMAAGIAHEIRNPLASIQLFAEVLGEDLHDRPVQAEICHKIESSVQRMDTIVRDVLRFAREATVRHESIPSSVLIHSVIEACSSQAEDAGVVFNVEVGDDPFLSVDHSLMTQAISNILRNAVEAMRTVEKSEHQVDLVAASRRIRCPEGGTHDRIVLSVADRGPGIDEETMSKLFNPFFTTRDTGTGLGLAIAHRVVDAHGGHIAVSRREGGGPALTCAFP